MVNNNTCNWTCFWDKKNKCSFFLHGWLLQAWALLLGLAYVVSVDVSLIFGLVFSQLSITILTFGATRSTLTFPGERLGWTHRRPSYRHTGTHPFPRSALACESEVRLTSSSSTNMRILCSHWLLTGHTAPHPWVVTRGRGCLVRRRPYSKTATWKASTQTKAAELELELLETMKTTAKALTPGSGLAQGDILMIPTHVETRLYTVEIMGTSTSKPTVISWFSDIYKLICHVLLTDKHITNNYHLKLIAVYKSNAS